MSEHLLPASVIGVVAFAFIAPLSAETMFKCRDSAGRVNYTDQPCETSGMSREAAPAKSFPAPNTNAITSPAPNAAAPAYRTPEPVDVPSLPEVDVSGLPRDAQGRPVLSQTPGASLVLEKSEPGPVQALARCSALVTRCVEPGKRDLDACFLSAPRCATNQPWLESGTCCPPACRERYVKERQAGKAPLVALDSVLFGSNSCVPGLRTSSGL